MHMFRRSLPLNNARTVVTSYYHPTTSTPLTLTYFFITENFLKEIELEAKVTKQQATQILEER